MEAIGNLTGGMARSSIICSASSSAISIAARAAGNGAAMNPEIDQLSGEALDAALRAPI
jgi:hypothetical protein